MAELSTQSDADSVAEAIIDRGMARAIELGYVEQADGMVRLLPHGRQACIDAAGFDPGEDPQMVAAATMIWFLELSGEAPNG